MTVEENLYTRLMAGYDESLSRSGVDGTRVADRLNELSKIGVSLDGGITDRGFLRKKKGKTTSEIVDGTSRLTSDGRWSR